MSIIVFYDIVNDKVRNQLIKLCKDSGLYRVQKSVFMGQPHQGSIEELKDFMKHKIDKEKDSVYIVPVNKKELSEGVYLGQAFDMDILLDNATMKIF